MSTTTVVRVTTTTFDEADTGRLREAADCLEEAARTLRLLAAGELHPGAGAVQDGSGNNRPHHLLQRALRVVGETGFFPAVPV